MTNIYDLAPNDLQQRLTQAGQASFRAQQIFKWVYEQGHNSFDAMHNISQSLRRHLGQQFYFELPRLAYTYRSRDGTTKFVFEALKPAVSSGTAGRVAGGKPTGAATGLTKKLLWEAVAIPEGDRVTLCVSSQVGCNMGCTFCFTGLQKMQHRLSAGQIVGQYLVAQAQLAQLNGVQRPTQSQSPIQVSTQAQLAQPHVAMGSYQGRLDTQAVAHEDVAHEASAHVSPAITNVVFMGMGEPLDNCDEVFKAIEILKHNGGISLSRKKITLSTSGLVDRIPRVTESGVYLAVSLNATTNKLRSQIMPINKKWPLEQLLEACRRHTQVSGHKVTFEYVLLHGVNDSLQQASELHKLTANIPCKINLIPFNPHTGSLFKRPPMEHVHSFQRVLMSQGRQVYIRKTKGADISAACGQLNPTG